MQETETADFERWTDESIDVKQMTDQEIIDTLNTKSVERKRRKVYLAYAEGVERGGDIESRVREIYKERKKEGEMTSFSEEDMDVLRKIVRGMEHYSTMRGVKKYLFILMAAVFSVKFVVDSYNSITNVNAYGMQEVADPHYGMALVSGFFSVAIPLFAFFLLDGENRGKFVEYTGIKDGRGEIEVTEDEIESLNRSLEEVMV